MVASARRRRHGVAGPKQSAPPPNPHQTPGDARPVHLPTPARPTMNLILWRHADADNFPDRTSDSAPSDLARELTPRGQKQAEQTAKWLKARLPEDAVVLCSPAARTLRAAKSLTHDAHVVPDIPSG